ncbi:MAG: response regulator [Planctomycetes bacterium]|nr:response regulator [Planctomycetota bacterium]
MDDNPTDIDLLSEALLEVAPQAEIDSSTSAHLALGLLQAACNGGPAPQLVVLDLRMPMISGTDLLRGLLAQPDLAGMRIVMLSGLIEERDRERCRQLGVAEIWQKPNDHAGYLELARRLVQLVP